MSSCLHFGLESIVDSFGAVVIELVWCSLFVNWIDVVFCFHCVILRGKVFDRSFILWQPHQILWCDRVLCDYFWWIIIYVVCFGVLCLRCVFWRDSTLYFDVVIYLIPLTDSFFFCVINQDFCFVLAWSLKYILVRSLFMFVFWSVVIYVECFDVVLQCISTWSLI